MGLFRRRRDRDRQADQQSMELLDQYHPRASFHAGDRIVIAPGKVLEKITMAMERVDLDVDTEISFGEDVASEAELLSMIADMRLGQTVAVHLVNTALRIMTARYPAELVENPLPPVYDLRVIVPQLTFTDREHATAKAIFNQRTTSPRDLDEDDLGAEFDELDEPEQLAVIMALFCMFGTKVSAIKNRTGIA